MAGWRDPGSYSLPRALTLAAGRRLGPYEILSPLGAGGMGEVYRAKDTRLERTVAVKVLPSHLSASPDSRQRFEREAKTISQLSHPHICALHDVGSQDGVEYLVMELLEGETLSERLAKGALPLEQTLRYGQEIADALDKAHRQGIVHRDLKPGNVMLTKTGVKLLDFGLAKAMAPASSPQLTSLPTQQNLTQEGTILGTFQYMAPEQLEGKEADARTDTFAFGAVLYEMATGRKAFAGATQASLIGAILHTEPPPISTIQTMSPAALDRVVKTCLAKDPEDRWQSAADVARELKWIGEGSSAGVAPPISNPSRPRWREAIAWALAAALALTLLVTLRRVREAPPTASAPLRFSLELPKGDKLPIPSPDGANPIQLLSGGKGLVYVTFQGASTELKYLDLVTGEARTIPGTAGATQPFLSPDGRWIGFIGSDALRKVAVAGGTPFDIVVGALPRGAFWSPDGSIYFTPSLYGAISRVSQDGGAPVSVTKLDPGDRERTHRWPEVLPGGRGLVYAALGGTARSWNDGQIVLQRLDTNERRVLVKGGTSPHYVSTGHLTYERAGSIFAVPFDLKSLTITGPAVEIVRDVFAESTGGSFVTAAETGLLVYVPASGVQVNRVLTRVDRSGRGERLTDRAEPYVQFSMSPDGGRLASDFDNSVSIFDLKRQSFSSLPTAVRNNSAVWAPDGKKVLYATEKNGPWSVVWRAADGTGDEHDVLGGAQPQVPIDVSRDGRWLLIQGGEKFSLNVVPLSDLKPSGPAREVSTGRAMVGGFSPDGRWIVCEAPAGGRREIYVVPTDGGEGRWQVSTAGGSHPRWSASGKEIFYLEGEKLMAVPVSTAPRFEAGSPRELFSKPDLRQFDVDPDGQHFILAELPSPSSGNLAVIQNWFGQIAARSVEEPRR
jgi:eukaryotic-like serine/threonine-protein kinase